MSRAALDLLVVEDSPGDQLLLADSLAQSPLADYRLTFASLLEEALEQLKQRGFDLALLDLGLPDSFGLATFTRFQAAAPHLPVIVLSGQADEALALEAMQNGAQDYLVKGPAGWSSLERAIRYAIERQRAQERLRTSEAQLRALVTSLDDIVFEVDEQGTYLNVWAANEALLFAPRAEIIGRRFDQIFGAQAAQPFFETLQRVLHSQAPESLEYPVDLPGGQRWFTARFSPIQPGPQTRKTVSILVRDITKHRLIQDQLRQSEERFTRFFYASPVPMVVNDVHTTQILDVNESYERLLGYSREEIIGRTAFELRIYPDKAQVQRGLQQMYTQGGIHGLEILLQPREGPPRTVVAWSKVVQVGEQLVNIGTALDISERRQAELERDTALDALESERALLRTLIDNLPDLIFLKDRESRFLVANQATAEFMGAKSPDQLIGRTDFDFYPSEVASRYHAIEQQIMQSGEKLVNWERTQLDRDGNEHWLAATKLALRDAQGQLSGLVGIERDLTVWRQAETALRESERRFSTIFENSPLVIAISRLQDGILTDVNPAFSRLFGYEREQVLGHTTYELNLWWDIADRQTLLEQLAGGATVNGFESAFRHQSGRKIAVLVSAEIVAINHAPSLLIQVTDITERNKVAESLRQSQAELAEAQRIAKLGSWRHDSQTDTSTWSDEMYRIFELDPAGFDGRVSSFLERIHPDDRELVIAADRRARQTGQPFEIEFRIITPAGEKTIREIAYPLFAAGAIPPSTASDQGADCEIRELFGTAQDITQQKHTEAALRASEEQYRRLAEELEQRVRQRTAEVQDLYDNAPAGYHSLDPMGRVVMVNQTELDWLGYSREQVLGRPMPDFLTAESLRIFRENFPRLIQTGRLDDLELEFIRQDGSTFPALVNASAIYDAAGNFVMSRSTVLDITERKKAEKALRESEAQNRLLFDESPVAVVLFDAAGQIVRLNRAAENLMGLSDAQSVGRTLDDLGLLSAEIIASLAAAALQDFAAEQSYSAQEFKLQRPGGQAIDVSVRVFGLQVQSRLHFLVSMVDITLIRQAEEALRLANQELGRAMRLKDEFLASMSHELRTPLTGILGMAEILQLGTYGELNAKQDRAAGIIQDSGRHLLELINDMLDLSKIEAGMLELEIQPLALEDICQASLQLVKGMAGKKRQQISLAMTPPNIAIQADGRRLKQMLVNLLSNAIKFTPEAGPIGLQVRADPAEQQVRLTVWDTGVGIAPQDLERLFQPFVQLNTGPNNYQAGTGLGLVMVKRLAELHGGGVSVTSAPGQGSRFTIALPWQPEPPDLEVADADGSDRQALPVLPNADSYVILLAEDTQANILLIGDFLENLGCHTIFAANGYQALERAQECHPDLILMDVLMPEMDGLSAIRLLRQDPDFATTPIIALTALAMPGDRERCLAAGASDYLTKPVRLAQLGEMIRKLLDAV